MPFLSSALLHARLSASYGKGPDVLCDVEFEVQAGEIVGLVGESGSGKSTIAMAILRLLEYRGGTVKGELRFQGCDLLRLSERQMRAVRGRQIGLVMQSPLSSLNPAMTIGDQIREAWVAHPGCGGPAWGSLLELLDAVNLPPEAEFLDRHPRQISVGQAQRVLIAMAIVHRPSLLVADEPTSALDTVTQAEIVKLFARLNRQLGMSILYISHDLLSVASLCDRIAILRHGQMVESGSTKAIFRQPSHPYTKALLAAIPAIPFLDNLSADSFAR
jgi:ABC-type dipeptide/oligopeptide/nickel transport system ATPase component